MRESVNSKLIPPVVTINRSVGQLPYSTPKNALDLILRALTDTIRLSIRGYINVLTDDALLEDCRPLVFEHS